jgi:hypothetical protein
VKHFAEPKQKRKGLRPLSQTGLIRVPANPRQRNFGEGGTKEPGKVLDAFNERQEDRQLHPTKGWRNLNVKRSRAQLVIAEIRAGRPLTSKQIGKFIAEG